MYLIYHIFFIKKQISKVCHLIKQFSYVSDMLFYSLMIKNSYSDNNTSKFVKNT